MKNDPESKPTDKLKRNHHGRRVEELERLRVKRREKRLKADPPLAASRTLFSTTALTRCPGTSPPPEP